MGEPLVPLRVTFEVTAEPWTLPIDAIVLSVGDTFGSLATAMRSRFPDLLWDSVSLAAITSDKPGLFPLGPRETRPWLAIMATPHEDGGLAPTINSIEVATRAAIREAARNQVLSIGVPMLGTGALGIPVAAVAAIAVPAAIDAAHQANVEHLAFLTRRAADVPFLEAAANGRLPGPDTLEAHIQAVDLAGGVSTDRVDPNTGIPLAKDHLGVAPYVAMLAAMIADEKTPTPLSVGVFGEWGSGKSYFMGLLRNQVDELAGNPGYCGEVAQIGFNAWHYADTNLWASLGDEIFRQLAGPGPNSADRRRQLRAEMAERLDKRRELEVTTQQARSTVAKLQASVDDAAATREIRARDLIAALRRSPELRINALWRKLGVDDTIEQAKLLSEQLHGTLTDVDALRRAPRDRIGKLTMAVGGLALVACAVLAAFAPEIRGWLAGIGGVFAVVSGIGVTVLTRARSGLRALRSLSEYLRSAAQEPISPEVAAMLGELRQAEADQRVAQAQLDEVVSHVGELGRQLTELAPGRRLYSFIVDRAHGDAYAGNLGLISMIRKDFEQLIELMADWRAHPDHDNASHRAIDRIVLYIDDLDRCGPAQVVEVLQAVHLLLALDLFVVVIGVDPRWLLRSLASHYDEILDTGPTAVGDAARWHVTPEDYLEKIINIPIALPGMPSGSLRQLLRSIVEDDGAAIVEDDATTTGVPTTTTEQPTPTTEPVDTEMPVETGSEISERRGPTTSRTPPRPLTEKELVLLSTLDVLIDTPREAKRLFNLYRMLRATRDLAGASRFLGEDGEPGDYQAVVVLLGLLTAHSRLLERVLDTRPDPDNGIAGGLMSRPPDTDWVEFVADFEPRGGANRVVGTLAPASIPDWTRLHTGLARVSAELTLPDLSRFQEWVPRIRRFSYTLSSAEKIA